MRRLFATAALLAAGLLVGAAPANAAPVCAAFNTCQYLPNPNYDGPLMPTWEIPPYGGPGNSGAPIMCDPGTYTCDRYVPGY